METFAPSALLDVLVIHQAAFLVLTLLEYILIYLPNLESAAVQVIQISFKDVVLVTQNILLMQHLNLVNAKALLEFFFTIKITVSATCVPKDVLVILLDATLVYLQRREVSQQTFKILKFVIVYQDL